jgi:adenosylcobyric acid synthase
MRLQELEPLSEIEEADSGRKSLDGYVSGNCLGTYVHGIFTSGTFRTRLLQLLFARKEIAWEDKNGEDYLAYKNRQYDLLADLVRENMDMEQVYRIIGI